MRKPPFFIIGHPRSGTTLLRMILCAHSQLYIPEESGFIPFLKVDPHSQLSRDEIRQLLERIGRLNAYWKGVLSAQELANTFPIAPTMAQVLDALYSHFAQQHHAVRWGDKTPLYIQYIPEVLQVFPRAVFIHLIRDGRDAALSARRKWSDKNIYMDLYYLLHNWTRNVQTGREHGRQLGSEQYLEIHYEDLVTRPQKIIPQVCAFLDERFEPAMLDHTSTATEIGPGHAGHLQALQPIFQSSIGRWQTEMSAYEKKLANRIAGEGLLAFGYSIAETEPMTRSEQIRYRTTAARFFFFDSVRTLLYRSGLLTLNRTMRQVQKPESTMGSG